MLEKFVIFVVVLLIPTLLSIFLEKWARRTSGINDYLKYLKELEEKRDLES